MKIISLLFGITLLSVGSLRAADELHMVCSDAEGGIVTETAVNLESTIRFADGNVEVYKDGMLVSSAPLLSVSNLTFKLAPVTAVKTVTNPALRLVSNRVTDKLVFAGSLPESASLCVAALDGTVRMRLHNWQGEPVNVADLTPGLYFVTVDKTTFKFIKK